MAAVGTWVPPNCLRQGSTSDRWFTFTSSSTPRFESSPPRVGSSSLPRLGSPTAGGWRSRSHSNTSSDSDQKKVDFGSRLAEARSSAPSNKPLLSLSQGKNLSFSLGQVYYLPAEHKIPVDSKVHRSQQSQQPGGKIFGHPVVISGKREDGLVCFRLCTSFNNASELPARKCLRDRMDHLLCENKATDVSHDNTQRLMVAANSAKFERPTWLNLRGKEFQIEEKYLEMWGKTGKIIQFDERSTGIITTTKL